MVLLLADSDDFGNNPCEEQDLLRYTTWLEVSDPSPPEDGSSLLSATMSGIGWPD